MVKIKNLLLVCSLFIFTAALSVGGTLANPSVGDLAINQFELQRKVQSSESTGVDNLTEFQNGKLLIPAIYEQITMSTNSQKWPTDASDQLYSDDIQNVIDKFVFIENVGDIPAYIRTWFAFEQGDLTAQEFEETIKLNINNEYWSWETVTYDAEINGNTYAIKLATYKYALGEKATTVHPSLLQVMIYNTVTTKEIKKLDGDHDDEYDILVLTQAVSDSNAWSAFGTDHPWTAKEETPSVDSDTNN